MQLIEGYIMTDCKLFLKGVQLFCVLFQVCNSLTNSSDGFSLLIRNGDIEFFFKLHNQLNGIERIGTQIIRERSLICNFSFVNS